jgi:hypothetical protein
MSTRCQIEFYDVSESEQGEPVARIYKHSDGYPSNILPMLKELEKVLGKDLGIYGTRTNDPEWAAAEFISRYRPPSDAPENGEHSAVMHYGRRAYRGQIYVTMQIHPDIAYLYRVTCGRKWTVQVFTPKLGDGPNFDIVSFEELDKRAIKAAG